MGTVKLRYYTVKKGRGFWQPTPAMRALGFMPVSCGPEGPTAWEIAKQLNDAWDARSKQDATAAPAPMVKTWPAGSIGEAFAVYRSSQEWTKKAPRTREDWERGWKYIEPIFGDCLPYAVTMHVLSDWRQGIEERVSLREAHRAMKIWRALWKVMGALRYCPRDADPSLAVRNTEPKGRSETWTEGEAVRLIKRALRMRYYGLAAALACMWDGAVAPVDARTLKLSQRGQDDRGMWFALGRAKTGRDAVLTLSRRAERLLKWYLAHQFGAAEPIGSMEVFRTRRGAAYRKNSFAEDFRDVRAAEFPGDSRMMLDFRRSGSVEAVAGGVDLCASMPAFALAYSRNAANDPLSCSGLQPCFRGVPGEGGNPEAVMSEPCIGVGPPFQVVKRNKRLWIQDADGRPIYTPPDFIRLQSREPMWQLVRILPHVPYIVAVMAFEACPHAAASTLFRDGAETGRQG